LGGDFNDSDAGLGHLINGFNSRGWGQPSGCQDQQQGRKELRREPHDASNYSNSLPKEKLSSRSRHSLAKTAQ
jgi:hypothetical protein